MPFQTKTHPGGVGFINAAVAYFNRAMAFYAVLRSRFVDRAAAEDGVAVVEHGGLTGGDGALRRVEADADAILGP